MVLLLSCPLFVVTRITPLAPLIPYKAVAAASFNILNDSISSASNWAKLLSNPSTITNGVYTLPLSIVLKPPSSRVRIPRILKYPLSYPGKPAI